MHPNEELITNFYEHFEKRDAEGLVANYDDNVTFNDPVFQNLHGERARNMWRMLCERGKDLVVEFSDVKADDTNGSAHWEAWYTFANSGRKVHNVIDARFVFKNGKIAEHTDSFDLHRWAGQALGPMGKLLGGTGFMQKKIRAMAVKGLDEYSNRH